ncbi:MAG: ATP-binding protein [Paracoccus sp. (in: a-proteobacteria)]|uniref:sensor histidine kinase n=1 Tax=Paracoccus sp. TaxID=267 RepID=UPI0026DFA8BA|nr:ATP-binding protein [Paracoccus sp. (in: a-proteobacteria)]MDO5613971.1 ATP-binding protein [Paracoccus sp. (in: a-proteobacteria)]
MSSRPAAIDAVLQSVPVAILVLDRRARVVAASAAARAMFGDDLLDRPFVTVLRQPMIVDAVERALAAQDPRTAAMNGAPHAHTLRANIGTRGRDLACDITVAAIDMPGGGVTVTLIDRSGQEYAEQMRRDFVANVSHELRTPLTALMGFIETLRGPARNDTKARERFLTIMGSEVGRMNRLVMDLLSLSRVESEERRKPVNTIDLAGLVRSVAATLTPTATAAGVRVAVEGVELQAWVAGDHDQLVQVFQNLVENAVKYGGSGGSVTLRLSNLPYEPVLRGPAWAVVVEDKGEGIDPLHLPRLTERFYRVDSSRSRSQGGTGLGLAIVKHIISRHRGRLRIDSEPGKGSQFTVILPQIQPTP